MEGCEVAEEAKVPEKLCIRPEQRIRHAIDSEYARVCRSPVDGLYITPSADNLYVWFGILFVRRGYYGGGIFRFTVKFPEEFPNSRSIPLVVFESFIFHPSVNPKAPYILDLKKNFPDGFKKEKHNILNILIAVQRVFFSYEADLGSCSNPEAAILWNEHKDKFKELCRECVNTSREEIFDDPPYKDDANAIKLTPWDSSIHEAARERMMKLAVGVDTSGWNERLSGKQDGFSWLDIDRMTYMTEPVNSMFYCEDSNQPERDRLAFGIERLDLSGVSPEGSDEVESEIKNENDFNVSNNQEVLI